MRTTKVDAIKEKIDAAKAKAKALEAELRKAETRATQLERKRTDRQKFILGNYLKKRMDADENFKNEVMSDLARDLDRNVDRVVFGLSEIEEAPKKRRTKTEILSEALPAQAPVPFGDKPRLAAQSFDEIVGQLGNN